MQVLIDVGCGPGKSTRPLARHLDTTFSIDPSLVIIDTAKHLSAESPEETASGKSLTFCVGRAEEVNGLLQSRSPGISIDVWDGGTCTTYDQVPPPYYHMGSWLASSQVLP